MDLVLLIESGLSADRELLDVVQHVFAARATHRVPTAIADPPPRWRDDYPVMAAGLTESGGEWTTALELVRDFWALTLVAGAGDQVASKS